MDEGRLKKNLLVILFSVLMLSNLGIFLYYELDVEAQSVFSDKYTIQYDNSTTRFLVEEQENRKGCAAINHDYINKAEGSGIITFSCEEFIEPEFIDPLEQRLRDIETKQNDYSARITSLESK